LNPVKANLVTHPEDWPYSNYLEWVKKRGGTLVDREIVNGLFTSANEYENFVFNEIDNSLDKRLQKYYLE
jgi:hypothetical protein